MRIAFVCTNYNDSSYAVAAVRSLRVGDGRDCPVFIVDNASEESHLKVLRAFAESDENVVLIEHTRNEGYLRGLNVGLRALREAYPDVDVVVAGNNDLLFPADFISSIRAISDRLANYAIVSPDIVTGDGEHQNPHVIDSISRFREAMYDVYYSSYVLAILIRLVASKLQRFVRRGDEDQHENAMEITQGYGACYLLGRKFFSDYGELWAPTFLFGEEFFLSLQLKQKGQRIFYEPAVHVTHVAHSSVGALPIRTQWDLGRTSHRIYRKHNPIWGQRPDG